MRKLRTTIGGLMMVVLVAAIGMAALRNSGPTWAGVIFMMSWGFLGLTIVGALVRRGPARAGWIGCAVFGCGYIFLTSNSVAGFFGTSHLPSTLLLEWLHEVLGHPAPKNLMGQVVPVTDYSFFEIGHGLLAIIFGLMGGIIGRLFHAMAPAHADERPADAFVTTDRPRRRWVWPVLCLWLIVLLVCLVLAIRSGPDARIWAGSAFFLTCGVLGLVTLLAIFGRGRRRQAAIGAALFGICYLYLAFGRAPFQLWSGRVVASHSLYQPLPTSSMLNGLRRWTVAIADGQAAANARIVDALEQPIDMTFPDPTPLKDVLRYIQAATATPGFSGIPIYLEPGALKTDDDNFNRFDEIPAIPPADAKVTIDMIGVPLKTSLRLCLEQLELDYCIREGYLRVGRRDDIQDDNYGVALVYYSPRHSDTETNEPATDLDDPFLMAGHCLLSLLAAGFGALAAPIVAEIGSGRDG